MFIATLLLAFIGLCSALPSTTPPCTWHIPPNCPNYICSTSNFSISGFSFDQITRAVQFTYKANSTDAGIDCTGSSWMNNFNSIVSCSSDHPELSFLLNPTALSLELIRDCVIQTGDNGYSGTLKNFASALKCSPSNTNPTSCQSIGSVAGTWTLS